jgi:hypothetical protein
MELFSCDLLQRYFVTIHLEGATLSLLCSPSRNDLCRQLQAVSRWGAVEAHGKTLSSSQCDGGGIDLCP